MRFKRVVALLALILGASGMVACLAGSYAVFVLASGLHQANDSTFAMLDLGLTAAQARVRGLQQRAQRTQITATELAQHLQDWGTRKAKDELLARLELERRADKLEGQLDTVESWLATAIESTRSVQQVLELSQRAGAPVEPASLDGVLARLTSLSSTMQQTAGVLDEIRRFTTSKEAEAEENRLQRARRLIARVLATLGDLETRLDELPPRLVELQTDIQQAQARVSQAIVRLTVAGCLVLAWIAAGQAALGLWGWKGWP
jgi:hypothetical protein